MVAVSAILYIKAKKLRKGQKLQSSGNTMCQISKNCKIELKYKKKKFDLKKNSLTLRNGQNPSIIYNYTEIVLTCIIHIFSEAEMSMIR